MDVRVLSDVRSAATTTHDKAAGLEQSIRARHRDRADAEPARQIANRRQPAARLERSSLDGSLERFGYFSGI